MIDYMTIIGTVAAALAYSFSAYFKKSGDQDFDITKMASTTIFGLIVGILAVLNHLEIENAYMTIASMGFVTILIENIVKTIIRKFKEWNAKRKLLKNIPPIPPVTA